GLDISIGVLSIAQKLNLSQQEALFLESRQDISMAITSYLSDQQNSQEAKDFAKWAVGYLKENPNSFNQAFKDLLNGVYNENSPIYLPSGFNVEEDQAWNEIEDEAGIIASEIFQQGLPNSDTQLV
ncbi:hypothetical protein, partial [Pedobacter xixiisoli]